MVCLKIHQHKDRIRFSIRPHLNSLKPLLFDVWNVMIGDMGPAMTCDAFRKRHFRVNGRQFVQKILRNSNFMCGHMWGLKYDEFEPGQQTRWRAAPISL